MVNQTLPVALYVATPASHKPKAVPSKSVDGFIFGAEEKVR
jgi:hypothetical protein